MKSSFGYVRLFFLILAIAFAFPVAAQMSSTFMSGSMYGHYYHYVDPIWVYEKRKSEGRDVTNFQREKSGIGVPFANIKIIKRNISVGLSDDQVVADSSADLDKKTKLKMHFSSESSWEIGKMGSDAATFLSAGVGFNYWSFQETNNLVGNAFGPKEFTVWQMYVPVTFDYKFGAEAKMSKSLKTGYTLGVGPVLVMSAATCSDGASAINFKAAPFLKFSYGFFWHTFLSIEATALGSKFVFMDNVSSRDYDQSNGYRTNRYYTVQSSSVYTIGITWMPFSFDWED